MRLTGQPLTLAAYPTETIANPAFAGASLEALERCYLPPALTGLIDRPPVQTLELLEDDNRGAVSAEPIATLDGLPFYLSVKGIGSATDPFSPRPLDAALATSICDVPEVRARLAHPTLGLPSAESDRIITGELWLRGSPYGGQGLEHAATALAIARRADLTSLNGFRIAPVVRVALLPAELEERLRTIHWYRRYPGRFVQELRLVPSNVRVYFHARSTLGSDVRLLFDRFALADNAAAIRFETAFIRSALAMLTLFGRTLRRTPDGKACAGLDFHDVWLDKDSVLAPDGTVFFVDLEGIEEVVVPPGAVREKIEDQIYRSLYEFMYGYEQIEQERLRRFGGERSRKSHFRTLVGEAIRDDPFLRLAGSGEAAELEVRNPLGDAAIYTKFPLVTP